MKTAYALLAITFVLIAGCVDKPDMTPTPSPDALPEPTPTTTVPPQPTGVAKWYTAGQSITSLTGEGGEYELQIGDVSSSLASGYEVSLTLYQDGMAVDSESLGGGESTDFKVLDQTINVLEVWKFEVGAEPFKVKISIV